MDAAAIAIRVSSGEPVETQHAAILSLCRIFEIDHVQRLVADPDAVRDEAFDAIGRDDLDLLGSLLMANPAAAQGDGVMLIVVLMGTVGQGEQAEELARHDAEQLTAVGRRARVASLGSLRKSARSRPDVAETHLTAVERIAAIYEHTAPETEPSADAAPPSSQK